MGGYKGGWIRTLKCERKKNGKIKTVDFKHADHMMNFLNLNWCHTEQRGTQSRNGVRWGKEDWHMGLNLGGHVWNEMQVARNI